MDFIPLEGKNLHLPRARLIPDAQLPPSSSAGCEKRASRGYQRQFPRVGASACTALGWERFLSFGRETPTCLSRNGP